MEFQQQHFQGKAFRDGPGSPSGEEGAQLRAALLAGVSLAEVLRCERAMRIR